MKLLISLPIIYTIIRLSAYGAWNVKNSNICGATAVGVLDVILIVCYGIFLFYPL